MDGFCGPFDEGLSYKGGALPSPMHPGLLATALGDGCDAAVLLHLGSVLESIPVLPEGSEKPGREDDARARQGSEQRVVRQCGYELCDSLIELSDEHEGGPELFGQGQGFQGAGIDDTGVVSQCCGCLDRLYACFDEIRSSDTVFPEEAFQGTSPARLTCLRVGQRVIKAEKTNVSL